MGGLLATRIAEPDGSNSYRSLVSRYGKRCRWLKDDKFLKVLERDSVDTDILDEELRRLQEEEPKTCRGKTVKLLEANPLQIAMCVLVLIDAGVVMAEILLDLHAIRCQQREANSDVQLAVDFLQREFADVLGPEFGTDNSSSFNSWYPDDGDDVAAPTTSVQKIIDSIRRARQRSAATGTSSAAVDDYDLSVPPTTPLAARSVVVDRRRRDVTHAVMASHRVDDVVRNDALLSTSRASRNVVNDDDDIEDLSPSGTEEMVPLERTPEPSVDVVGARRTVIESRLPRSSPTDNSPPIVPSEAEFLTSSDDGDRRANDTSLVVQVAHSGEYVTDFPDESYPVPFSYSLYAKKLLKIAHILHYGSIAILGVFVVQVLLKVFGLGVKFFHNKLEVFDALIIMCSFALDLVFVEGITGAEGEEAIALIIVFLLWRILRVINGIMVTAKQRQEFRIQLQKRAYRRAEKKIECLEDDITWKEKEIHNVRGLCQRHGATEEELATCKPKRSPFFQKMDTTSGLSSIASLSLGFTMSMRAAAGGGGGNGAAKSVKSPWSRTAANSTAVVVSADHAKNNDELDTRPCKPPSFADRFLQLEGQTTSGQGARPVAVSDSPSHGSQTQQRRSTADVRPGERLGAGISKNADACSRRKSTTGATSAILESCRSLIVPCVSIISAPLQSNEIDRSTPLVQRQHRPEQVDLSGTSVVVEKQPVNETVIVLVNELNSGTSGTSLLSSNARCSLLSDSSTHMASDLYTGSRAVAAHVEDGTTRRTAGDDVTKMDDISIDVTILDDSGNGCRYNRSTESPSTGRVPLETTSFRNQASITKFVGNCAVDSGAADGRRLVTDSSDVTLLTSLGDSVEKRTGSTLSFEDDEQTSPTVGRTVANADDASDWPLELRRPSETLSNESAVRFRTTSSVVGVEKSSVVSTKPSLRTAVLLIDGMSSATLDNAENDGKTLSCPSSPRLASEPEPSTEMFSTGRSTLSSSPLSPAAPSSNSQSDRSGASWSIGRLAHRATSPPEPVHSRPATSRSSTQRHPSTKSGNGSSNEAAVTQFSSMTTPTTENRESSLTWQFVIDPCRRDSSSQSTATYL